MLASSSAVGLQGLQEFESSARSVLQILRESLGFPVCAVTVPGEDDRLVLMAAENEFGVHAGGRFSPARVAGGAEMDAVARSAVRDPALRAQARTLVRPDGREGTYLEVPLENVDGSAFGALCVLDPSVPPREIRHLLGIAVWLGRLLASVLAMEERTQQQARQLRVTQAESLHDPVTGLGNRRYWINHVAAEDARCRRYGGEALVIAVEVDELAFVNAARGRAAGDELLREASIALLEVTREHDVVARVGGDEFGVLAVACPRSAAGGLADRIRSALARRGVAASVGTAPRSDGGLARAWHRSVADLRDRRSAGSGASRGRSRSRARRRGAGGATRAEARERAGG